LEEPFDDLTPAERAAFVRGDAAVENFPASTAAPPM
jgi:hypothetical protein